MLESDRQEHDELREIMIENQRLLTENNQLLNKLNKRSIWSFWFRVVWSLIIIGAPFILYFYVIEPYFTSLDSSLERFQDGLQEMPGWKQFYQAINGDGVETSEGE